MLPSSGPSRRLAIGPSQDVASGPLRTAGALLLFRQDEDLDLETSKLTTMRTATWTATMRKKRITSHREGMETISSSSAHPSSYHVLTFPLCDPCGVSLNIKARRPRSEADNPPDDEMGVRTVEILDRWRSYGCWDRSCQRVSPHSL